MDAKLSMGFFFFFPLPPSAPPSISGAAAHSPPHPPFACGVRAPAPLRRDATASSPRSDAGFCASWFDEQQLQDCRGKDADRHGHVENGAFSRLDGEIHGEDADNNRMQGRGEAHAFTRLHGCASRQGEEQQESRGKDAGECGMQGHGETHDAFARLDDGYASCLGQEQQDCHGKDAGECGMLGHGEMHDAFTRLDDGYASERVKSSSQLPSIDALLHILAEQRKKKEDLKQRCIYSDLCSHGLETHPVLANYLVPVLVECGSAAMAQQLFEKLIECENAAKEHAWTYMIRSYVECGRPQLALDCFAKMMQEAQVHPSMHTFVYACKACESLRDVESGRILHIEVAKRGHEADPFISNCMMYMYIKCGSIPDAERAFDQLVVQDVIAVTAMMAGYVECGMSEEALEFWGRIQEEDAVVPDSVMFLCCLRACGSLGDVRKGREIHTEIILEGLESSSAVTNTLIDMYLKCGLLKEAQELSDEHMDRDLVTWTSLITGYAENGFHEKAVECFAEAQLSGVVPDAIMYACCLKACCSMGAMEKGMELHQEVVEKGFSTDQIVGNMLVDMYSKSNMLDDAVEVFRRLPRRDVVSWTALIGGYAEHGFHEHVRKHLMQMKLEGCCPNVATYVCCVKGAGHVETLSCWGLELHAQIVKEGFEKDMVMNSALVDMYAQHGSFFEAEAVLKSLRLQNVFSWSALIAGYAENGATEAALRCMQEMEQAGISPCAITLISCLKACSGNIADLESGHQIHTTIVLKGLDRDVALSNALIGMYVKCESLASSSAVFNSMVFRDVISWTTLMVAYTENGLKDEAADCLRQMQVEQILPDSMSWNTLIESLAIHGDSDNAEALSLYMCMQEQGFLPGSMTFANLLQACGNTAAFGAGKRIHAQLQAQRGLRNGDELLCTVLIDMYGKCGSMVDAQKVFDAMKNSSLVQWNALITGYAHQGQIDRTFHCLHEMLSKGVQPDEVTFVNILFTCSHGGLVERGQLYFRAMITEYGIDPTIRHLGCIVDLLGRVGQLDEAVFVLDKVEEPDLVAWNSVLGASQKLGNVQIGEQAFESTLQLNEQDPTSFIMMSNMYANFAF